jgi:uncharacterized membrane protein
LKRAVAQTLACICLIALIALCLLWEAVLAPIKPGGSLLMLKALPLLTPLFGLLRGKIYTYRWVSFLCLAYFCEGVVRAWSEHGTARSLAVAEIVLSSLLIVSALVYVRASRAASPESAR